jgi:5-methylcytosine-specific restriction endonuclease McrA
MNKARIARHERRATRQHTCRQCDVVFTKRRRNGGRLAGGARFCSERCRRISESPTTITTFNCKVCKTRVATSRGDLRRVYCSRRCHDKGQPRRSHFRRARRFGGAYDPTVDAFKVFERDGWRCQMCGCDTPRELRGRTAPNAPELDHIIPMADGGGHTWDNVRCACYRCNHGRGWVASRRAALTPASPAPADEMPF